ncbi:MAG: efflux RND transporter periplasmic adaptor subunit [Spirochaetes bacterium]|nr:efflux RND transporter periplasmic adaptor subunit [Spirochaetota bacterium]
MKKSRIVSAVLICFIVFFAALIGNFFIQQRVGAQTAPAGGGGGRARGSTPVRVVPVEIGVIERGVVINGDVLARSQVSIFPTVGGRVVESSFNIGDWVNAGQVVARIDPSRPGEVFSHSPVLSTVSGTVLHAPFNVGDTVTPQSALYIVGDLSSLLVETFVPERFVSAITQGLRAGVHFESFPGETFHAEIFEVSPVLDPLSRTLRINLRFINPNTGAAASDPRVRAGMFATVSLVTTRRANVPVIPRASILYLDGTQFVFTVDEDNVVQRQAVTLGLYNEDSFEVLAGLNLGEKVITAGQNFLAEGDTVIIVD